MIGTEQKRRYVIADITVVRDEFENPQGEIAFMIERADLKGRPVDPAYVSRSDAQRLLIDLARAIYDAD